MLLTDGFSGTMKAQQTDIWAFYCSKKYIQKTSIFAQFSSFFIQQKLSYKIHKNIHTVPTKSILFNLLSN